MSLFDIFQYTSRFITYNRIISLRFSFTEKMSTKEDNNSSSEYYEYYCCPKKCVARPRTVVDGQLPCGCFSWCTCACCRRVRKPTHDRGNDRCEFVDLRYGLNCRFCCELRCVRMPETVVDGPLRCGCWSWCVCECVCKKGIFDRNATSSNAVSSRRKHFLNELLD